MRNRAVGKELYEDLSAIHAALPETERERFAEIIGALSTVMAAERRQIITSTAQRWRRDAGYPRWMP